MNPSTKDPLDALDGLRLRTAPRLLTAGTMIVASAFVLAACSGSSKPKAASTPSAHSVTATSSAGSSAASAPASGDAAMIKSVYEKFIDLSIPVDQKLDLIQDGADFKDAMEAEAKNPQAKNIGFQVTDVKVTSASLADVTFTILSGGSPLLANQHGFAVKEGGTWKVSGATFCGLLAAQAPSAIPAVCSKAAATALPTG